MGDQNMRGDKREVEVLYWSQTREAGGGGGLRGAASIEGERWKCSIENIIYAIKHVIWIGTFGGKENSQLVSLGGAPGTKVYLIKNVQTY